MYQPKKYLKQDQAYIFKFIQQHPFATLVIQGTDLLATHIPVLVKGTSTSFQLYSHIANHNEMHSFLKNNTKVLLIFQGAHGYISSSLYQEKDISTWDYSAVHISANIQLQSLSELKTSLAQLVNHFENKQEQPLTYNNLPTQMVEDHLPLITGFWLKPYQIKAIAKHHQGAKITDVKNVMKHLAKEGNHQLAEDLKKEHFK